MPIVRNNANDSEMGASYIDPGSIQFIDEVEEIFHNNVVVPEENVTLTEQTIGSAIRSMRNSTTAPSPRPRTTEVDVHYERRQTSRARSDYGRGMSIMQNEQRESEQQAIDRYMQQNGSVGSPHMCSYCFSVYDARKSKFTAINNVGEVCEGCIQRYFRNCDNCSQLIGVFDLFRSVEGEVCSRCVSKLKVKECTCCGILKKSTDVSDTGICTECQALIDTNNEEMNDDEDDFPFRHFDNRKWPKYCSSNFGSVIRSKRIFSAEIECQYPDSDDLEELSKKQPRSLGICTDGSISGHGVEFQTPKLQGLNGEEFIRNLTESLSEKGFTTDKTCGLHIHLDGGKDFITYPGASENINGSNTKTLLATYMLFEDVLQSFLPRSRRNNNYCKPLSSGYHLSEVMGANSLFDLERIWYRVRSKKEANSSKQSSKHSSRYAGVNFHTLLSSNHIEIRYHSGTINGKKILEWINLHTLIMDKVASGVINLTHLKQVPGMDLEEKTEFLFGALDLAHSSKKYFLMRQSKFKQEKLLPEEKIETVCVE